MDGEKKCFFLCKTDIQNTSRWVWIVFFHWAQHRWSSSSFHFRCQSHNGERFLSHHELCASSEFVERHTYRLEVLELFRTMSAKKDSLWKTNYWRSELPSALLAEKSVAGVQKLVPLLSRDRIQTHASRAMSSQDVCHPGSFWQGFGCIDDWIRNLHIYKPYSMTRTRNIEQRHHRMISRLST